MARVSITTSSVRRALELAGPPRIRAGDRVAIKPNIVVCPGKGPYGPGAVTDLRVVRDLLLWLREAGCLHVTIAEGAGGWQTGPADGWVTDWNGEFGGLSYAALSREFGAGLLDLNFAAWTRHETSGRTLRVARAAVECDLLFSLSPLKTNKGAGVSLAMKNLFGIAPGACYGFPKFGLHALGPVPELVVDLYAARPDAYAILGGSWAVEGDADLNVRFDVMVAGANAVAADRVAAAVMGFAPEELEFLRIARARGWEPAEIQIAGKTVEEVRRPFRRACAATFDPSPSSQK